MTDAEIIDLFFERSEQAIPALAEKHGKSVERVAWNILGNHEDAEECVNDTWLGAWNSIPPHAPSPLRTYVCRIARNLAMKSFHSRSALKRNSYYDAALDELEDCIPDRTDVEGDYLAKELSEAIDRFLDSLSYDDRFLFMRRYWYADSLSDISQMNGMSYNRVSVRLFRLREKLKSYLIKEGLLV